MKRSIYAYTDSSVFQDLKEQWEDLSSKCPSATVFQSIGWNALWWKHFGSKGDLFILTYRDHKDDLCGIAPFYVESNSNRSGGKVRFLGGMDITDYEDFIYLPGKEDGFYRHLEQFLAVSWKGISLDLHFLRDSSPALGHLNSILKGEEWDVEVHLEELSPFISLPDSWEGYLGKMNKKQRHEIRRKFNRVSREGKIKWYQVDQVDPMEEEIATFIELHKKSRPKKALFMNPGAEAFFLDLALWLRAERRLELNFLTLDGVKIASLFSFRDRGSLALYNSGYDPLYGSLSPGILIICYSIKNAIRNGFSNYDFLRGTEEYKYRLGAVDKPLYALKASRH